jgi:hypothetical protein
MMYFYGGGYSDIKANTFDWNIYFDKLYLSKFDAIGYAEKSIEDVAPFWNYDDQIDYEDVKDKYNKFAGNGHYIFKEKTKFAEEWLKNLHSVLDHKYELLRLNPGTYHPYAIKGGIHHSYNRKRTSSKYPVNYPIEWNEINGRIKQKIEYLNNFSNFLLEMPYVNMKDYR